MRKFLKISTLLILFVGCEAKKMEVDVPWYISLNDDEQKTFNVPDSIKKYEEIGIENVVNRAQFLSFMANLNALAMDSLQAKKYLRQAVAEDSMAVCKYLAEPLSLYLGKSGPNRETAMPSVLNYELDYLIALFYSCQTPDIQKRNLSEEEARLFYTMRYIRIRDHWYRSPLREMDRELQAQIDKENRKLFQKLFQTEAFPQKNYFKGALMLLVAHSDDLAWTKKWLNFYLENYKNEPQTPDFIRQFNRRSPLAENSEIREILGSF